MGSALIADVGTVSDPGASMTAATFVAPSTNVVRNSALTSPVMLTGLWRNGATNGAVQVTSPKLVPVSHGIEALLPSGVQGEILRGLPAQVLTPQDQLAVALTGGASESDQAGLQSYYRDLPGVSMVLKSPGDILGVTDFTFAWPVAASSGAVIGGQGNVPITETVDSSTANRWYALLGYLVDKAVTAVGITGVDSSQTFCGGPGIPDGFKTRNYFADLSVELQEPCVPLFNAANKSNTNVTVVDVTADSAVNVTLILAELAATYTP